MKKVVEITVLGESERDNSLVLQIKNGFVAIERKALCDIDKSR